MQTVAVIGAGGLGHPATWGLVEICKQPLLVSIIDPDSIETSNLNRQIFFSTNDLNSNKAEVLAQRLRIRAKELGKKIEFCPLNKRLSIENIDSLLGHSQFVIEASDSPDTKFLVNDYCVLNKIPCCYGGSVGLAGLSLPIFNSPCLRCVFGDPRGLSAESCSSAGILGATAAQVGFEQAKAAINYLENSEITPQLSSFGLGAIKRRNVAYDTGCPLLCGSKAVKSIDLRDQRCPATYLYTKVAIEQSRGEYSLDLRFTSEESSKKVSFSCAEEGHTISIPPTRISENTWRVVIEPHE